jgi:hypothetical protein
LYYRITAVVFLVVALLHAVRLINGWEATLGEIEVPLWVSAAGLIIAGYLSYRGFTTKKS